MRIFAFVLVSAVAVSACGGPARIESGATPPESTTTVASSTTVSPVAENQTPAIMSVAMERLVTEDNTFGQGPPPFTEYLVQNRLDLGAPGGSVRDPVAPRRELTGAERSGITATLEGFGRVRWIDNPDDWRTDNLAPSIEGSVILGIGEPMISGDAAKVFVSLWCGGLCGTWFTYQLQLTDSTWSVTGIDGPVAIS